MTLSPPSIRMTLPLAVSITAPSPCWTSTKFTRNTRSSVLGMTTVDGFTPAGGTMNPDVATGVNPSSASSKVNSFTSTCSAVTRTTSTASPHAITRRNLPFSGASNTRARSTLITCAAAMLWSSRK